jgi:hypothetical protein
VRQLSEIRHAPTDDCQSTRNKPVFEFFQLLRVLASRFEMVKLCKEFSQIELADLGGKK